MTSDDERLLLSVIGMLVYDVSFLAQNTLPDIPERDRMVRECVAMSDLLMQQLKKVSTP